MATETRQPQLLTRRSSREHRCLFCMDAHNERNREDLQNKLDSLRKERRKTEMERQEKLAERLMRIDEARVPFSYFRPENIPDMSDDDTDGEEDEEEDREDVVTLLEY